MLSYLELSIPTVMNITSIALLALRPVFLRVLSGMPLTQT